MSLVNRITLHRPTCGLHRIRVVGSSSPPLVIPKLVLSPRHCAPNNNHEGALSRKAPIVLRLVSSRGEKKKKTKKSTIYNESNERTFSPSSSSSGREIRADAFRGEIVACVGTSRERSRDREEATCIYTCVCVCSIALLCRERVE